MTLNEAYELFPPGSVIKWNGAGKMGIVLRKDDPRYLDKFGVNRPGNDRYLPIQVDVDKDHPYLIDDWPLGSSDFTLISPSPFLYTGFYCAECNERCDDDYLCLTCRSNLLE